MSNIPDDVQPYVALNDGAHLDGVYEAYAAVGDEFAPDAREDGESNA